MTIPPPITHGKWQLVTVAWVHNASTEQLLNRHHSHREWSSTAGTAYTISFEFNTQNNGVANELDVLWDGTSVLDLGPGGRQDPGFDSPDN